jgi:hypothetical protein
MVIGVIGNLIRTRCKVVSELRARGRCFRSSLGRRPESEGGQRVIGHLILGEALCSQQLFQTCSSLLKARSVSELLRRASMKYPIKSTRRTL